MRVKNMKLNPRVPLFVLLGGFILSACGGAATPTFDVSAIYTSAAQTFAAQQATKDALIPPTFTPFPVLPASTSQSSPTFQLLVVASSTLPPSSTSGCDNSVYIKDVTIPDGSVIQQGQTFVKTWLVQNTGTCTWSTDYKLGFVYGEAMGGTTVSVSKSVAPNQQIELTANLTAPAKSGSLTGNWKLINNKGQYFGTYLSVVINVSAKTGTPGTATMTPTITSTQNSNAATSTFTPTLASTATYTPTIQPSPTYTPTETATP